MGKNDSVSTVLRYYSVFSADQRDGVSTPHDDHPSHDWIPLTACERLVEAMPSRSRFPSAEGPSRLCQSSRGDRKPALIPGRGD